VGERLRISLSGEAWGIPTLGLLRLDPEALVEVGWAEDLIPLVLEPGS